MKQKGKLVQIQPNLPFVWRPSEFRRYKDCSHGRETGVLDSALHLDFDNFEASLTNSLVFYIVAD